MDTDRLRILLSLKELQEDPLVRFADRVGEVVSGRVSKLAPIGVLVRVAEGAEGSCRFPVTRSCGWERR